MRCLGDIRISRSMTRLVRNYCDTLPSLGVGQVPVSLHAAARRSACAVTQAGGVSCWGDSAGRDSMLLSRSRVPQGVDRLIASPQANHFCAVNSDEALWCS